jgi:3',5'-cyclic AMP phosphodiesterase CpdA
MYIIRTRKNITRLSQNIPIPKTLVAHLSEYFQHLQTELANDEEDTFTLDHHRPIILLESGDDLHNLSYAGLYVDVLSSLTFEFVEIFELEDVAAYRMVGC